MENENRDESQRKTNVWKRHDFPPETESNWSPEDVSSNSVHDATYSLMNSIQGQATGRHFLVGLLFGVREIPGALFRWGDFFTAVFFVPLFFATGFLGTGFFMADFLTTGFFKMGFLAADFLTTGFFVTGFFAADFFTAGFLGTGFFAVGFLTTGFFAAGFLFPTDSFGGTVFSGAPVLAAIFWYAAETSEDFGVSGGRFFTAGTCTPTRFATSTLRMATGSNVFTFLTCLGVTLAASAAIWA
ncbi:MAG TPA: hypothetical protein PK395_04080 [bacterium]|nr:hypothetical protein [bacterium]HQP98947.1 hypothetical protein [bacterium]